MIRDDLIFDVGMHRGEDTAYYLAKGFRVVAFEADPEHVSHSKGRFADALRAERLTIVEGAIAPPTQSGHVIFYKNLGNSFQGTTSEALAARLRRHHKETVALEVRRTDMAEAFRAFGVPYYLKVDIEGADRLVLVALRDLVARPAFVSMESEKENFSVLVGELALLRELGYGRFAAIQQKYIRGTTISTKDRSGNSFEFTFEGGASGPFGDDIAAWQGYDQCVATYEGIFRRYRWFGERSWIAALPGGRQIKSILRRTKLVDPLPGWYDTHAALR